MCGIAGYFHLDLKQEERLPFLRQMCDAITHRGPDDSGYYADDNVGLGMRRLSIIDLTTGHQPIANEDSSLHIVFNGEIYNYQGLRPALMEAGHHFQTQSDTEVILHQFEQDGPECVHHFNGMFAIAVWDARRQSLFLVRDRMGVKPLYYYWDGRHFLFASEIKALLASNLVPRRLNQQALWDYLTFRYIPQPETIWENIYKLPPAHHLVISADHPAPVVQRYWDIPYGDQQAERSPHDYEAEFESLFLDAVRLRLIADVPVGVLLSGGLDSSSVAAAISEVHNVRLDSFTVAFRDSPSTNELPYARQLAAHAGTNHHEILIGEKEFMDFLPRLVHFTDEPLADLASVPLYYVSALARQSVKVVLSGEGSDEVLAGYDFDRSVRKWNLVRNFQALPVWLRQGLASRLAEVLGGRAKDLLRQVNVPLREWARRQPFNMTNYLDTDEKSSLLCHPGTFETSTSGLLAEAGRVVSREPLHQVLYVYCQSWLVEDLLMKADKMTMANSIELRVPFLDYRLVEWAARAPAWVKVKRTGSRYQTKWVLRQFARHRVPAEIISRPKQGFPVPVYDWLSAGLKPWVHDMLCSRDAFLNHWFEPGMVQQYVEGGTHVKGTMRQKHILWNLLILEQWLRVWQPA